MIGRTLSRYKVLAKLGEGGMGEVYLAEDTELGREVALKILPPMAEASPERLERFRREARAVASLNHPNIVTLFNVEESDGRRLIIMERVEGKSLDRLIPPGGMPLTEVFAYAIPMADALASAHDKGITHRDLKPANVMVTAEGQIKVLDFGLAKLAAETGPISFEDAPTEAPTRSAALTGEGMVMGTAPYMSPEQLKGQEVDPRSDIFSFGILLYEMVTGKRPFQGDSGIELASSILKDRPSSVAESRADLPRHLGRIIQHCLEKDPERRFQAAKRALELDPELLEPRVRIIMMDVERGKLVEAFKAADRLVDERPRVGRIYFLRAYVLRYGGAIEASVRDCETALSLDSRNQGFRSCGITNSLAGHFDRAKQFLDLNPGNDFYYGNLAASLLRQGRAEEALEVGRQTSYAVVARGLEPFVDGRRMDSALLEQLVSETEKSIDAEQAYWDAGIYAVVGEHEVALRFLREAIDRGYCSYPYLETDPLFAGLRTDPDFADGWAQARAAGQECHESFLLRTRD